MDNYSFFKETFPAIDWIDLDTNQDTELTKYPRSVYVGEEGNVSVVSQMGTTITFQNVLAGTILPIQPKQVNSSGTTATGLVGLL